MRSARAPGIVAIRFTMCTLPIGASGRPRPARRRSRRPPPAGLLMYLRVCSRAGEPAGRGPIADDLTQVLPGAAGIEGRRGGLPECRRPPPTRRSTQRPQSTQRKPALRCSAISAVNVSSSRSFVPRDVVALRRRRCRSAAAARSSAPESSSISSHCAIQPAVRGMANSTGNISTGKPIAW